MKPIYVKYTNKDDGSFFVTAHHANMSAESFVKSAQKDSAIYGKRNTKCTSTVISKQEYERIVSTDKKEQKSKIELSSTN